MKTTSDFLGLQAALADTERRVSVLEERCFAQRKRRRSAAQTFKLYIAAHQPLDRENTVVLLWIDAVLTFDLYQFVALARVTLDPFPWRPFLLLLDEYTSAGFDTEEATDHLLELARSLMDLQGLDLLEPRDVLKESPLKGIEQISYKYRGDQE